MPDINEEFEKRHRKNLIRYKQRIEDVYNMALEQAARATTGLSLPSGRFAISRIPLLNSKVNRILTEMNINIRTVIVNGISTEWDLSNKKNDTYVDQRLSQRVKDLPISAKFYDPNAKAMEAFVARKVKGMNLSDRVWKNVNGFRNELEAGLGLGISRGQSATSLATELKQYLRKPDKLFRRVRDEKGNLQLSQAALNYKPGQGVYRSSFKNSLRLSGTETNMAYRQADYVRWQKLPFVVGQEIRLSNRHPEYDICDVCAGRYPKDFIFNGWHPQCICFKVPIMMTDEEYERYEDALIDGIDARARSVNKVTDVPQGFKDWISDNRDRVQGWSSPPYWVKENFKNGDIDKGLKFKVVPENRVQGSYLLDSAAIDRLKAMGVRLENEPQIPIVYNNYMKGFDLESLFNDFDDIGDQHGITWRAKRIGVMNAKQGTVFIASHVGDTKFGEVYIERNIKVIKGKTEVYHAYFKLPEQLQGSGISKQILKAYYDQYLKSGIDTVSVFANLEVGGYTWAKYGFGATDRYDVLSILRAKERHMTPKQYYSIVSTVKSHFDATPIKPFPMRLIADLGAGTDNHYGKKILLGTNWAGKLDLSDREVRRTFEKYLYGTEKTKK